MNEKTTLKDSGAIIRTTRIEKSWTPEQLAEAAQVAPEVIEHWEAEVVYPNVDVICTVAEVLEIQPEQLFSTPPKTTLTMVGYKIFEIVAIVFVFASMVCLVCNIQIQQTVSWSLYPIGAMMMLLAMLAPIIFVKSYKWAAFTGVSIVAVALYLTLIAFMTNGFYWLFLLALPITLLVGALTFVMGAGVHFFYKGGKINMLETAAMILFLYGIVLNAGVDMIVHNFLAQLYASVDAYSGFSFAPIMVTLSTIFILCLISAGKRGVLAMKAK